MYKLLYWWVNVYNLPVILLVHIVIVNLSIWYQFKALHIDAVNLNFTHSNFIWSVCNCLSHKQHCQSKSEFYPSQNTPNLWVGKIFWWESTEFPLHWHCNSWSQYYIQLECVSVYETHCISVAHGWLKKTTKNP